MEKEKNLRYKAWLRSYYRGAWLHVSILLVLTLILVGIELANPWPLKLLADSVFGDVPPPGFLAEYSRESLLVLVAFSYIGLYLFGSLFAFINDYLGTRFKMSMDQKLKENFFWHVLHLPVRDPQRLENSDYVYRLNDESNSMPALVFDNFITIVSSTITIGGVLIILLMFDWQMTLLALAIVPFLFLSVVYFGKRLEKQSEIIEEAYSDIYSHTTESIENTDIVQSFNRQQQQVADLGALLKRRLKEELKSTTLNGRFSFTNSLLSILSICVVIVLGGHAVFNGRITFGDLLIFVTYTQAMYDPLQALSEALGARKDNHGRLKRVFEVIYDHADIENTNVGAVMENVQGRISFRKVSFSYKDKVILDNVTLDVRAGEKVGFIGPSGTGKSTMLSLLPRFGLPDSGFIYIDGQEISTLNLKSLREQIAIVSQEPKLFSITIGENIAYAYPDETNPLPDIMRAAVAANASEFIDRLPDKYDTPVNGSGTSLSGGQKQRVAVARAMFKRAPILILDEPTSAQDTSSENKVLDGINHLMHGKTVMMVTHKHSLLSAMDTIYVIEDGKIRNVKEYGGLDSYERYLEIHELKS